MHTSHENDILSQEPWHTLPFPRVLDLLASHAEHGLSEEAAAEKLKKYGENRLQSTKRVSPWRLLLAQFQNLLVIILLIATALSGFLGEEVEAITIAAIVLLAVVLGFVQEYRAENAMEALKEMAAPTAKVIRGGEQGEMPAIGLVPGDIIVLAAGDRIPADARLIQEANLRTEEAALTGESLPSEKTIEVIAQRDAPVGDRRNMLYGGTSVSHGRATAVVTATGMHTEFGKIATMLQNVESEETPLQQNLDRLGKALAKLAVGVVAVISIIGWYRGDALIDIFLFGIALAVAVVPEALPAVVTISLAIGVQRMVRRHALIRKLPAVETLGCTSVICTDKTGTLTKDEMTIRQIWVVQKLYDVSGAGYAPIGNFSEGGKEVHPHDGLLELLRAGVLSSDARLIQEEDRFDIAGDPTEGALVVAAAKAGLYRGDLEKQAPRIGEIPFTSETKRMVTLHKTDNGHIAYAKGAPEMLLPLCNRIWGESGEETLSNERREEILAAATTMASQALRVLAIARKGDTDLAGASTGMKFIGLVGMIDPPRPEVRAAIRECHDAGIRVIMITGDHPVTAEAIAKELGILTNEKVATGLELEKMSDEELDQALPHIAVFARVSPSDKLRLVTALQAQGHVVAMTGDGVNDAPALKKADIGVAMGITGTDVTKEAAAMTLTDDNFASIVAAIEEGRGIFGNIKKYLMYLLSSNVGEIIIMTVATLLGWPLPLSAVQLLYLNLATDGFPALALAVDPPERDLMTQSPRNPRTGIFTRSTIALMLTGSVWLAVLILGIFWWTLQSGRTLEESMTMAFVLLVVAEFVKAYNFRSDHISALRGTLHNRWLNIAILWELLLLLALVYVPFLQVAFGTFALKLRDWGCIIALALTIIPVLEAAKWMIRRQYFGVRG
ncbi:MAG: Ca2+-transporting ATPase [Candidatus Peregrinibacteria bacterium Greene1014_49]|nr:MAG: Ca2+-transporting ATPase [Candidatus Peregrinibacteria bacterium Greene1014_49]